MTAMRAADLVNLAGDDGKDAIARGQNFVVEAIRGAAGDVRSVASASEIIVICADAGVTLTADAEQASLSDKCVAILPPGETAIRFDRAGRIFVLATDRTDAPGDRAANAASYARDDERVAPIGEAFEPLRTPSSVATYRIADLPFPPDNPRLKFLQSATMSINWVEYSGVRDRSKLSPHSHVDYEQGSLAIAGRFLHHLRTPWKADANAWREDQHVEVDADTMLVIPPEIIHTTEGLGDGEHILIDVFAPPRRDFLAKGWMHNAANYRDPASA